MHAESVTRAVLAICLLSGASCSTQELAQRLAAGEQTADRSVAVESVRFDTSGLPNSLGVTCEIDVVNRTSTPVPRRWLAVYYSAFSRFLDAGSLSHFFDAGVFQAIRPRGLLDSEDEIRGPAIETLLLQHLRAAITEAVQVENCSRNSRKAVKFEPPALAAGAETWAQVFGESADRRIPERMGARGIEPPRG